MSVLSLMPDRRHKQPPTPDDPGGRNPPQRIPSPFRKRKPEASAIEPPRPIVAATIDTPLRDFVCHHYAAARDVSAESIKRSYITPTVMLSRFLKRTALVSDLNTPTVNAFVADALTRIGRVSVNNYRRQLLMYWRFAFEEGIAQEYPRKVRRIKIPARIIEGYDVSQFGKLLAAADGLEGAMRKTGVDRRIWFITFLQVAWFTGLRLSDVFAIERDSITVDEDGVGRFTVIQHKTGHTIPRELPPHCMQQVDRCMASGKPRKTVLPFHDYRVEFYREYRHLADAAGVGGTARWLRRGSASEVEHAHPGFGRYHCGHKSSTMFDLAYRVNRIVQTDVPLPPAPAFKPTLRIEHKPDAGKDGAA
jgi:integrase